MNGNAQILEAIKADHSGIGYVDAGYVIHGGSNGTKVLISSNIKTKLFLL
jgi:phosphate transport system substrate-binding protein